MSFECQWGANRGHLPLKKVTYASVGPACVSVIRMPLRLDLPSVGPPPGRERHSHSRVAAARFAGAEEGSAGRATLKAQVPLKWLK